MAKHEASDEELAAGASRGDQTAFGCLVERYGLRLLRLLILACGLATDEAEDVAQDVWLKAWQGLPMRQPGPFRGWLFTIARHAAIDSGRKTTRRRTQNDSEQNILARAVASDPTAENVAALTDCLEQLKPEFRDVVVGFAAGEQYDELATRLLVPINTVKSRLSRARDTLKKCMGEASS